MLSIFDIFKVGVGPSSSHTNGPMLAGFNFTQLLQDSMAKVHRVQVDLYGSLSLTGRGHHTDRATVLGLMGNKPDNIKMTSAKSALQHTIETNTLLLAGTREITFSYDHDIVFHSENLPLHENGMTITALDESGEQLAFEIYYSIGGGFIATADELENGTQQAEVEVPFPFTSADEMLEKASLIEPDNADIVFQQGVLKLLSDDAGSDEFFKSALDANPESDAALSMLIVSYVKAGKYDEAFEQVNKIKNKSPSLSWLMEGAIYKQQRKFDEAKNAYQKALTFLVFLVLFVLLTQNMLAQ